MAMALTFFTLILAFLSLHITSARKLSTLVNPNCGPDCEREYDDSGYPNVVYTKSEGEADTVHHLWSTAGGNPSLLLLQAPSKDSLNITWNRPKEDAAPIPTVTFSGEIVYAFALVFNKICEYKDHKDEGSMGDSMSDVVCSDFNTLSWHNMTGNVNTSDQHTSVLYRTLNSTSQIFDAKGLLSLQLETQGEDGRGETIPRLLHTSNSSQVRLILEKFHARFEESRFAVELSVFVSEPVPSGVDVFKYQSVKSMDDEYTPGVFKSIQLLSRDSQTNMSGSYLAWKPVAYTMEDLSVTDSTNTVYYDFVKRDTGNGSTAESFFMENFGLLEGIAFNVSFGTSQDGYYTSTHYTQWSFTYGLGVPGEDQLSSLVKIIIASGLGLPMLLIILSCVYFAWHKRNVKKDDLSLSSSRR